MRCIHAVFDALRTFDRPATRRELERESGLSSDQVAAALRSLFRQKLLERDVAGRQRGTYWLAPGAQRPEDQRGRFTRDDEYRRRMRSAYLDYHAARPHGALVPRHEGASIGAAASQHHSSARPPSAAAASGVTRVIVRGVLDLQPSTAASAVGSCLLADVWPSRRWPTT